MKVILAILAVILSGCCTNVYIVTIEQPKEKTYTDTQTNKDNHSDRLILLRKAADESSEKAKKYQSFPSWRKATLEELIEYFKDK